MVVRFEVARRSPNPWGVPRGVRYDRSARMATGVVGRVPENDCVLQGRGASMTGSDATGLGADHGSASPRVRLYGKPGCHLCDHAREIVAQVCGEMGESWDEVDITGDEELYRRFWEQIPVTFVDGRQHDFWWVAPARLRAALQAPAR